MHAVFSEAGCMEGLQLLKHEATRYERAEGFSISIKNPNETISLVKKSTGFLLYAYMF